MKKKTILKTESWMIRVYNQKIQEGKEDPVQLTGTIFGERQPDGTIRFYTTMY